MRRTVQRATVIGGLALVGLLPIGATANASAPTNTITMTATASAASEESRICCVSGPYASYPTCERVQKATPRSTPCYSDSTERHWYFAYRP